MIHEGPETASNGDTHVDRDDCGARTVAPGGSCTVTVRYAPLRPGVTSAATLVFTTNTAQRTESVPLSGTSAALQWSWGGDGPAGHPGAGAFAGWAAGQG